MTTNRISGSSSPESDPTRSSSKVQREESQRIEKVGEVDPDEQAKQQRDKFKRLMDDVEEEIAPRPRAPSPFETQFHRPLEKSNLTDKKALPTPSHDEPPDVKVKKSAEKDEPFDLPVSKEFWKEVGLPDEPLKQPSLKEEKLASLEGKNAKKKSAVSPHHTPLESKDGAPSNRYWSAEEERTHLAARGKELEEEEKKTVIDGKKGHRSRAERMPGEPLEREVQRLEEREGRKKGKKEEEERELLLPSSHPLPLPIQTAATAAVSVATPYLSPEVVPLFYQFVGSIMVMASTPGVRRTVIVLNARSFSKSKFYGSTIEIVKYATAPDAINIELSGSNEAVAAFNQNVPNLLKAFEKGNFQFKIGQLRAVYSTK
ncbi:MAG: hypothetical protein KGJ02_01180 [Verrucomicrobiota bacterium]|nr:hypothetical protein [Verrucomicrobiota bacterium]